MKSTDTPSKLASGKTHLKNIEFAYEWNIGGFSNVMNRIYEIHSPIFTAEDENNLKWKLILFTKHEYPKGAHVAIRLVKMSDVDISSSVQFKFSLVDAEGNCRQTESKEKLFLDCFQSDDTVLLSHAEILKKRFLPNDCLTIRCELNFIHGTQFFKEEDNSAGANAVQCRKNHAMGNASMSNELPIKEECFQIGDGTSINDSQKTSAKEILSGLNYNIEPENLEFKQFCFSELKQTDPKKSPENFSLNTCKHPFPKKRSGNFNELKKTDSKRMLEDTCASVSSQKQSGNVSEQKELNPNCLPEISSYDSLKRDSLEKLSDNFNEMYTNKKYCDIKLCVKGVDIAAHSAVLSVRSDYFKSKVEGCFGDTIVFNDISTSVMEHILYYLYTGKIREPTAEMGLELLYAAKKFRLFHFQQMVVGYLKGNVTIQNLPDLLHWSEDLKLLELKSACLDFISKNYNEVGRNSKWAQVIRSYPHIAGEIPINISSFQKSNHF